MDKAELEEWISLANEDFELAEHLIEEKWFYRQALAHLQLAIEKYTKAFLLSKGWELRKIHNLDTLFRDAINYDEFFKDYLDFGRELTAYYLENRYPPALDEEFSAKEAQKLLKISKEFITHIKKALL